MKKLILIWNNVKSSNISSYAYTSDDLYIRFKSGAVYKYINVDTDVIDNFKLAESKGKFINTEIKGKYEFEKAGVEV